MLVVFGSCTLPYRNSRPSHALFAPLYLRFSNEDDLTVKMGDIVYINNEIQHFLNTGVKHLSGIQQQWDHLQVLVAMYINGDVAMPPAVKREFKVRAGSFGFVVTSKPPPDLAWFLWSFRFH